MIDKALRAMRNDECYQLPPLNSIMQVLPKDAFRVQNTNEQLYQLADFNMTESKSYEFKNLTDLTCQYFVVQ